MLRQVKRPVWTNGWCEGISCRSVPLSSILPWAGGSREAGRYALMLSRDKDRGQMSGSLATQGKWPVRTGVGRTQPAVDGRIGTASTTGLPLSKRSQYGLKRYANGASTASVYSRLSPSYARAYGPFSLCQCRGLVHDVMYFVRMRKA